MAQGHIGLTTERSLPTREAKTQQAHPNVVYIVLDDVGFAQLNCYGSTIETPNINALAADGLRYNNFHTTAICSATRASLLTGANHHAVGVSTVVDSLDGDFPNATGCIDPHYGTTAEVLREYGYANFAVGKWHLTPFKETTAAGPFHNWPLGKGFDRYYGFLEGMTDQYNPDLVQDNARIPLPKPASEGYHLSEDLADKAIEYVGRQHAVYPEQPFFLYLAFGAGHQPHQAPKAYVDKYKGKFDAGWDVIREQWFENQKKLGIVPEDAVFNPRNEYVQPWNSLSDKEKKLYARYMEVYAGYIDHADAQIGRVIDFLKHIGVYDNTIIVLLSDNGASAEGGKTGGVNGEKNYNLNLKRDNVDVSYDRIDEIGVSEYTNPHYPIGWANAGNTPFVWYKTWVHNGGVKDPLIVTYPALIQDKGGIRTQYAHVSDITPTVLDILGLEKPESIRGVAQQPYQGISFKYTFADPKAPSQKITQYYEMVGNRAIYHDGWKAVVNHATAGYDDYENDKWELYHVAEDYTESKDVATQYPEKVRELQEIWYHEAGKYGVLPLAANESYWAGDPKHPFRFPSYKKQYIEGQKFTYTHVVTPFDITMRTRFNQRSHTVTVKLHHTKGNNGILYTTGARFGGYVFYVQENHLKFTYNYDQEAYYTAISKDELPDGALTLSYTLKLTGAAPGHMVSDGPVGHVHIYVNGKEQGETIVEHFSFMMEALSGLKDGNATEVSPDFTLPFEYPAELEEVTLEAEGIPANQDHRFEEIFAID